MVAVFDLIMVISKFNWDLIEKMIHDPEFDPSPFIVEALSVLLDKCDDYHPLKKLADEYCKKHNFTIDNLSQFTIDNLSQERTKFVPGTYKLT